jgi:hypothetical protein
METIKVTVTEKIKKEVEIAPFLASENRTFARVTPEGTADIIRFWRDGSVSFTTGESCANLESFTPIEESEWLMAKLKLVSNYLNV